jgi:hypothetical protein
VRRIGTLPRRLTGRKWSGQYELYCNDMGSIWYNQTMRKPDAFRHIVSAPMDGTPIEVRHGPQQETTIAVWSRQAQGWVRKDDEHRRVLHQVTGWRPLQR